MDRQRGSDKLKTDIGFKNILLKQIDRKHLMSEPRQTRTRMQQRISVRGRVRLSIRQSVCLSVPN